MCVCTRPFWIVSLFLTDKKVSRVLVCSSVFIKFFEKNEIKCVKTFGMLTVAFG